MMENLRRLVWKIESLSEATATTTKEKSLPTIPEDNELDHFDQSNGYVDEIVDPQIYGSLVKHNEPNTTALGDINEEEETVFYMFPIKQETPLGEWMMGRSQSDYIIKCNVNHY